MNENNENSQNQKTNHITGQQGNFNMQDPNFNGQPKKTPWGDILLGLGLSILLVILIISSFYTGRAAIASIIVLILIFCATLLSVRFTRRNRPIVGKILLVTIIPLTLLLFLFGACFISLGVL